MTSTGAARQRRHRRHKAGDHSLCDPAGCNQETVGVTQRDAPSVTRQPVTLGDPRQPRYLRVRGRRLWAELTVDNPGPAEVVLIEEACRLADRLDKLDAILGGRDKAWITLASSDDGAVAEVVVDKALSEARQQQIALKQLLAELRASRAASAPRTPSKVPAPATSGGSGAPDGVADLTKRIAERRAQAQG